MFDRCEDPDAVVSDGATEFEERREPGTLRPLALSVEESAGFVDVEVTSEYCSKSRSIHGENAKFTQMRRLGHGAALSDDRSACRIPI